ncbi:hypothetical protein GL218_01194 [Daldinia childiae]|uniref:uncharacterized protein n=1 Tax=Daldinia childiae TaxID=326645 RepID=UPI0014475C9D|nr:uncharacterized protein GL218_01194 [Daldinia childiae]KAF3064088.1 hypothetical protein GL218_01194 [Daldinia childiae]
MAQSTKKDIGELANQLANDQAVKQPRPQLNTSQKTKTTEEKPDAAPFLCMLEPLSGHNVVLDMTRYFATQIRYLSQERDSLKTQIDDLTKQATNILLHLQESADAHKPTPQPIQQASKPNPVEQAPQYTPGISAISQLERDDIGRFNPSHHDERGAGMVSDGHTLIFTDVDLFVEHIESFLQDPVTASSNERQILQRLETLLHGPAALWWSHELTRVDRRALRLAGLSEILVDLERRFRLTPAVAAVKFEHGKLGLREIAFDENRPMQFVRTKLRYARAMELLDEKDTEWLFVMLQIWFSMDVEVRAVLGPPVPEQTLDFYLREINNTTPDLMSRALKLHY